MALPQTTHPVDPDLRFEHPEQHSLAHLGMLAQTLETRTDWTFRQSLDMAQQLAIHGHPRAIRFIDWMRQNIQHPDALRKLDKLDRLSQRTAAHPGVLALSKDETLLRQLYATEGYFMAKGVSRANVLVVVFTTMYNNFGISNLVLYALLRDMGVSVLLLRDLSKANYLGGANGLGHDLDSCAQGIVQLAQVNGCTRLLLMGFSSGGYAGHFISTLLPCQGYLGLSIVSDFSLDTPLPTDKFISKAIRQKFRPEHLCNLATLPDRSGGARRRLIVGAKDSTDLLYTNSMQDTPNLEVVEVPDCQHDTPETLMAEGHLQAHLDWLLEQA